MESRRSAKPEPRLLRVSEAAEMLNVSKDTIYRAVHKKEIPHEMVFGMIRIPRSAVKRKLHDEED